MNRHRWIGDVRGRGCLLGIELVQDRESRTLRTMRRKLSSMRSLSRGLSFKTSMGNVLTLGPPLTVTADQMLRAIDILDESLSEVERTLVS